MKIIYGLKQIKKFKKPVVALGVFDGVHCGHRRILKAVADKAKRIRGTSIVVTFWPHPQREGSIYSLEHRLRLINEVGIDICIVIKFNKRFSQIPAEDFIRDILVNKIGAQYIYVGRNFRFGKQARGDFKTLDKLSNVYNFRLEVFDIIKIDNQPISSTYIRRLITKGKLSAAGRLLSRPVSVLGTVIRGASLAAKLGFPTANIDPHHEVLPPSGIYAVSVIFNGIGKYKNSFFLTTENRTKSYRRSRFSCHKNFQGVCYIGSKPTLKRQKEKHIEVYIFNFRKNIYGKYLEIQFIKKIREERKFSSLESLAQQVKKDIVHTRKISPSIFDTTIYAH